MGRSCCGVWCGIVAGLLVWGVVSAAAEAGPRRGRNSAVRREATVLSAEGGELQREVDALRSDAQKANEEYNAAKKEMGAIQKEIEAAEKAAREAGRKLSDVAQQIEDAEPKESPLGQAKGAYLAARAAYEAAVAKAQSSAEFQAADQGARSAVDRAASVRAARKTWIEENPAVADASGKWHAAKSAYDARRDALLHKSAEWQRAAKELAEAKRAREDALHSSKGTAVAQREASAKKELAKLRPQLDAKAALLARVQAAEKLLPHRR